MSTSPTPRWRNILQEFSIPLIVGVFAALFAANVFHESYHHLVHMSIPLVGLSMHFLINDIFMVLFFGIAAKEITESCLPGGDLNPFRKAINPLFGTLGGVYGPVAVFLGLAYFTGGWEDYAGGWGIPTATDIALAWLVARLVFGKKHPAVNFLLLLAVADDAIGLGIIAVAYPDPQHDVAPMYLGLVVAGMGVAYLLRRANVRSWVPYLAGAGGLTWMGLHSAHLHPALALVFVVPFMPSKGKDEGMFLEKEGATGVSEEPNTLDNFEHALKTPVDFGLFFFAFANAGVPFSDIGPGTWYVLGALVIGKTLGITFFSWVGIKLGFPLPKGMSMRHLFVAGMIAGLGLTVALFVAGEAFEGTLQAEAKMGALMSGFVAVLALVTGRILQVKGAAPVSSGPAESLSPRSYHEEEEEVVLDDA